MGNVGNLAAEKALKRSPKQIEVRKEEVLVAEKALKKKPKANRS